MRPLARSRNKHTFFASESACVGYHLEAFCEWCGTDRSPLPNFFVVAACADMMTDSAEVGHYFSRRMSEEKGGLSMDSTTIERLYEDRKLVSVWCRLRRRRRDCESARLGSPDRQSKPIHSGEDAKARLETSLALWDKLRRSRSTSIVGCLCCTCTCRYLHFSFDHIEYKPVLASRTCQILLILIIKRQYADCSHNNIQGGQMRVGGAFISFVSPCPDANTVLRTARSSQIRRLATSISTTPKMISSTSAGGHEALRSMSPN